MRKFTLWDAECSGILAKDLNCTYQLCGIRVHCSEESNRLNVIAKGMKLVRMQVEFLLQGPSLLGSGLASSCERATPSSRGLARQFHCVEFTLRSVAKSSHLLPQDLCLGLEMIQR